MSGGAAVPSFNEGVSWVYAGFESCVGAIGARVARLLRTVGGKVFRGGRPVTLSLLSTVSKRDVFFLKPPKITGDLVTEHLGLTFSRDATFRCLVSHFDAPSRVFNPMSVSGLGSRSGCRHVVRNCLPSTAVIFLSRV